MKISGETAGKQRRRGRTHKTLRQKDRNWTKLWKAALYLEVRAEEAIPGDRLDEVWKLRENLSG